MKINKNCEASTGDFWYDLAYGGYLDPTKICVEKEDADRVIAAIKILKEFHDSCEKQIEDFIQ